MGLKQNTQNITTIKNRLASILGSLEEKGREAARREYLMPVLTQKAIAQLNVTQYTVKNIHGESVSINTVPVIVDSGLSFADAHYEDGEVLFSIRNENGCWARVVCSALIPCTVGNTTSNVWDRFVLDIPPYGIASTALSLPGPSRGSLTVEFLGQTYSSQHP